MTNELHTSTTASSIDGYLVTPGMKPKPCHATVTLGEGPIHGHVTKVGEVVCLRYRIEGQ